MKGNVLVVGLQWGDEGKGKIVDFLSKNFDLVVRYQGGHNAGHTVYVEGKRFALHLIPSGIINRRSKVLLGSGMVVYPPALQKELDLLEANGINTRGRVFISDRAHIIFPFYRELDQEREKRARDKRIGTTSRGIGPAYEAKAARVGIRVGDLWDPNLKERVEIVVKRAIHELGKNIELESIYSLLISWRKILEPYVTDSLQMIHRFRERGRILLEGAQGLLLDLDWGTYPYVTSSNPSPGGAIVGTGIPFKDIETVFGVMKAYTTRVGEGPFPTEDRGQVGKWLAEKGKEYGTTTNRARRCGWLDLVAVKYALKITCANKLVITKIDVLDSMEKIKVCTKYLLNGEEIDFFPSSSWMLEAIEPVYETLEGWDKTHGISKIGNLPKNAIRYLEFIEDFLQTKIAFISTGENRADTIEK